MRKKTHKILVGNIQIGGGNPVIIQSMTNTDTADINATAEQILELSEAGSEIVRITVDCPESATAVPKIIDIVRRKSSVPIVGDFHFNGHVLLEKFPEMAQVLDKYRINPGNVGRGKGRDENFERILTIAKKYSKPIRIGVNGGSLNQELLDLKMDENQKAGSLRSDGEIFEEVMVESVVSSANFAVKFGIQEDKIILSAKVSEPRSLIRIHQELSQKTEFPIHLGLTEAGGGIPGIVSSTAALSVLLHEGIGDTIRVSITPGISESRTKEVEVAREILQSLELRSFTPKITSCPGCGRTTGNDFQKFSETIASEIKLQMPFWKKKYSGAENLKIAVMGCIVNGPGEARNADIGIFFPGKGEGELATVFVDGKQAGVLSGKNLPERFLRMVEEYLMN